MRIKATDVLNIIILFLAFFSNESFAKIPTTPKQNSQTKQTLPKVVEDKNLKQTNFEKGLDFYNKKNYKQAFYWWTKSAQQGDPSAHLLLKR